MEGIFERYGGRERGAFIHSFILVSPKVFGREGPDFVGESLRFLFSSCRSRRHEVTILPLSPLLLVGSRGNREDETYLRGRHF